MVTSSELIAGGVPSSLASNLAAKINSLDPGVQDRYADTVKDFYSAYGPMGYALDINQAARTSAEQNAIRSTGVKAASPANSWHTIGAAADFTIYKNGVPDRGVRANNAYVQLLQPIAERNGLNNPIKGDVGHFQPSELPAARRGLSLADFINAAPDARSVAFTTNAPMTAAEQSAAAMASGRLPASNASDQTATNAALAYGKAYNVDDMAIGRAPHEQLTFSVAAPERNMVPDGPYGAEAVVRAAAANDPTGLATALDAVSAAALKQEGFNLQKIGDTLTAYFDSVKNTAPGAVRAAQTAFAKNPEMTRAVPSVLQPQIKMAFESLPDAPMLTKSMSAPTLSPRDSLSPAQQVVSDRYTGLASSPSATAAISKAVGPSGTIGITRGQQAAADRYSGLAAAYALAPATSVAPIATPPPVASASPARTNLPAPGMQQTAPQKQTPGTALNVPGAVRNSVPVRQVAQEAVKPVSIQNMASTRSLARSDGEAGRGFMGGMFGNNNFSPSYTIGANYSPSAGGSDRAITMGSVNGNPGHSYQSSDGSYTITSWTDSMGNNFTSYGDNGGGSGGGAGTVLCTYFMRKGWLDKDTWKADARWSREHYSAITIRGYHAWAVPLVERMKRGNRVLEYALWPIVKHWGREAAYLAGTRSRGSAIGKCIRAVLEPASWLVGTFHTNSNSGGDIGKLGVVDIGANGLHVAARRQGLSGRRL